jgi:hypothetical protein
MFASSEEGETPNLLGPVETANLNHGTTSISVTAAIYFNLRSKFVCGKCKIKIIKMHVQISN